MKKLSIALACILSAASVTALCACGSEKNEKKYTVTFDTKGGSTVASYKLSAGEKIKRPSDPTKEMFKFDDWYWENPSAAGEKQKFQFGTPISQNITLVAGWIGESSVRVTFDANGGIFDEDAQTEYYGLIGSTFDVPDIEPTRDGYEFNGWYVDPDGFSEFDFSGYPVDNATLYADWAERDDYAYISYYGNGELLDVKFVQKGENVVLPDLFTGGKYEDVIVGDWYTDEALSKKYTAGKANNSFSLYTSYYTDGLTITNGVVTGYTGAARDVVVPAIYNGVPVTSIGEYAFYRSSELDGITSVTLPSSVRRISRGAFYDCKYLVSVNLSENVTAIGDNAFYKNHRLKSCGDISSVTSIGSGAFSGCYVLSDITLNNEILSIGDYAFNDCRSFTTFSIPASVTSVGEYAFSGCTSLKTVEVQSMLISSFGKYAFKGCTALTSVSLDKAVDVVTFDADGNPFDGCRYVTIYVPSAQLEEYKNNPDNELFKDKFSAVR